MRDYNEFLSGKRVVIDPSGFDAPELSGKLYDFQRDLDRWAIRRGKAALFTMTGTGKTPMQAVWSDAVCGRTDRPVLILAPLAVAKQTVREAAKFGVKVKYVRGQSECQRGVNIANYEMLGHFRADEFAGLVLDESSILKAFTGRTRNDIIGFAQSVPYRLACTAKWRLKGHAVEKFWRWIAQFGVFLVKPSDLGYSDEGFDLPELVTHEHTVKSKPTPGQLFASVAGTLQERLRARRDSIDDRVAMAVEVSRKVSGPMVLWCNLNKESEMLTASIKGAVEITGSDSNEHKEKAMLDFAEGRIHRLVTKPEIAGFGMNWQVCADTGFVGLSDSFEKVFQATKRFHRHGQTRPVNRHFFISEAEGSVLRNVQRKEAEFMRMIGEMVKLTRDSVMGNLRSAERQTDDYNAAERVRVPKWLVTEAR